MWQLLLQSAQESSFDCPVCPQELDALQHELQIADLTGLPYLDAVYKESLRLLPPGHVTAREAGEGQTLGGHLVPKGTWIHVSNVTD